MHSKMFIFDLISTKNLCCNALATLSLLKANEKKNIAYETETYKERKTIKKEIINKVRLLKISWFSIYSGFDRKIKRKKQRDKLGAHKILKL